MRAGWTTRRLEDVCVVEYGTRVVHKRDGGSIYPVYGGGGATFAMDSYNREDRVVVSRFGMSERCTRFVDGRFFLNDSGLTLNTKDPRSVHPRFVDHWTLSQNDHIFALGKGSAQKNLDVSALRDLLVSFPTDIKEQQRIVGILDEAFDGITTARANAEANLQHASELFDSLRGAVFSKRGRTWEERSLAELCEIKHGFAFRSEFFSNTGTYVVLTPGNFYEAGGYRDRGDKQKYYSGEIPREYVVAEGDLLVAMTEQAAGLLGSPLLIPESGKFLHNQRLGLVISKPGAAWVNEFFFHVFNLPQLRKAIHDTASGVKVRHTSPTKIGEIVVSFPTSVEEQRGIAEKLNRLSDEARHLESLYRRKLAALDELKRSLLHQVFTGAL